MIFKLALKNIIGYGWRSLINIFILFIILTGMIWMDAMYYSWLRLARTQQQEWEYASGILRAKSWDQYDVFSWETSYAPIPEQVKPLVKKGEAVPILLSPAVLYPGGRMVSAVVKGIPRNQTLLKFPSDKLVEQSPGYTPALIGKQMAKSSRLAAGDIVTMRIKDSEGAYNTLDLEIVEVIDNPVPTMDMGTIWIDLEELQNVKLLPGMATSISSHSDTLAEVNDPEFQYLTPKELFAFLDEIMKTENFSKYMIYGLLMFLAMIAVFDSQALAVFKRRKEIGTFAALGMTKGQIIRLFTAEGVLYFLFAIVMTAVLGFPLFWYFATTGYVLPSGYDDFAIAGMTDAIRFSYPPTLVLSVIFWVGLITTVVSWLPARKIANMKPTDALRGKVN